MFLRETQNISNDEPKITTIPIEQKPLIFNENHQDEINEPYFNVGLAICERVEPTRNP